MNFHGTVCVERDRHSFQSLIPALGAELFGHVRNCFEAGVAALDPRLGFVDDVAVDGDDVQTHLSQNVLELKKMVCTSTVVKANIKNTL